MYSRYTPVYNITFKPRPLPLKQSNFRRYRSTKQRFHDVAIPAPSKPPLEVSSMSRLPTKLLLRSLVLTSLMSSKLFLKPALAILNIVTNSKSALLNPDRNPVLNKLLRWTVYDHFCAGTNREEVSKTVAEIKKIGYQGVILGYSREIVLDPNEKLAHDDAGSATYSDKCYEMIEEWKKGTLETLRMVGPGDFLAVKYVIFLRISIRALVNNFILDSLAPGQLQSSRWRNGNLSPSLWQMRWMRFVWLRKAKDRDYGWMRSSRSFSTDWMTGRLISCGNTTTQKRHWYTTPSKDT